MLVNLLVDVQGRNGATIRTTRLQRGVNNDLIVERSVGVFFPLASVKLYCGIFPKSSSCLNLCSQPRVEIKIKKRAGPNNSVSANTVLQGPAFDVELAMS